MRILFLGPHDLERSVVAERLHNSSPPRQYLEVRQFGIVDVKGNAFAFTGKKCGDWAGHKTGKNYACQGNILVGEAVVKDTAKGFEETKGSLALRLMAALEAGHQAQVVTNGRTRFSRRP